MAQNPILIIKAPILHIVAVVDSPCWRTLQVVRVSSLRKMSMPMQVIDHKHVEIDSSIVEASCNGRRHLASCAVQVLQSSKLVHAAFGTVIWMEHRHDLFFSGSLGSHGPLPVVFSVIGSQLQPKKA